MKAILLSTLTFISANSFAATNSYQIRAEVSVDGKVISRPQLVTLANETASISQKNDDGSETTLEVLTTDSSAEIKDGIKMQFTVSYNVDGKRKVISKPTIVTIPGETAEITVGKTATTEELKLKVIATRI